MSDRTPAARRLTMSAEFRDALEQFGLASADTSPVQGGLQSATWRVNMADRAYFVKLQPVRALASAEFAVRVSAALHTAGLPAARPLATLDGAASVRIGDAVMTISLWIDGVPSSRLAIKPDPGILGRRLAQVHQVLAELAEGAPVRRRSAPQHDLALTRLKEVEAWLEPQGNAYDRVRVEVATQLAALERIAPQRPPCQMPFDDPVLVHGDFQLANILCDPGTGEVTGLIDFDSVHYAPRIWDIARACAFICQAEAGATRSFIQGYTSISHLTTVEQASFRDVLEDYLLCGTWDYDEMIRTGVVTSSLLAKASSIKNAIGLNQSVAGLAEPTF